MHWDNQGVLAILGSQSCHYKHLMHLLWCLFYYEAHDHFKLYWGRKFFCKKLSTSRDGPVKKNTETRKG